MRRPRAIPQINKNPRVKSRSRSQNQRQRRDGVTPSIDHFDNQNNPGNLISTIEGADSHTNGGEHLGNLLEEEDEFNRPSSKIRAEDFLLNTQDSIALDDLPVEERLIQKGRLYKFNVNQKRHELIRDQIETGPTFQPTLISNNEPYLQRKRDQINEILGLTGSDGTILESALEYENPGGACGTTRILWPK